MWIFDTYYKGCIELWSKDRGLSRVSFDYPSNFQHVRSVNYVYGDYKARMNLWVKN